MRTGFPCNESGFFPVGIDLQGKAVSCTGFGFTMQGQDFKAHIRHQKIQRPQNF